jgi:hypothetical protein
LGATVPVNIENIDEFIDKVEREVFFLRVLEIYGFVCGSL